MTVVMNIQDLGYAEIEHELIEIVGKHFNFSNEKLSAETRLFNGGVALNSTQIIELTLEFERHFDIELEPELLTMENFETIGTLAKMVVNEFSLQVSS